jgi:hypothetical protein
MAYCNTLINYIDSLNNSIRIIDQQKKINNSLIFWSYYKIMNLDGLDKAYKKDKYLTEMHKELDESVDIANNGYFALGCPLDNNNYNSMKCEKIYNLFTHLQDKEYYMRKNKTPKPEYFKLMLDIETIYKTKCDAGTSSV